MRGLILLAVVSLAYAKSIEQSETLSTFGYNRRVAIPLGEEIRKAEEEYLQNPASRIAGGSFASAGQFPYQVGITFFGLHWGCQWGFPAAFARVSSYMSWFNQYL